MEEYQKAFEELKKFFISLPLLSKLEVKEELYLYVAIYVKVVNTVLVWVDDKGVQKSIYYTS